MIHFVHHFALSPERGSLLGAIVVSHYRDYTRLWADRFDRHPNALAHRLGRAHNGHHDSLDARWIVTHITLPGS